MCDTILFLKRYIPLHNEDLSQISSYSVTILCKDCPILSAQSLLITIGFHLPRVVKRTHRFSSSQYGMLALKA